MYLDMSVTDPGNGMESSVSLTLILWWQLTSVCSYMSQLPLRYYSHFLFKHTLLFKVTQNTGSLFTNSLNINFPRRLLMHGVGQSVFHTQLTDSQCDMLLYSAYRRTLCSLWLITANLKDIKESWQYAMEIPPIYTAWVMTQSLYRNIFHVCTNE